MRTFGIIHTIIEVIFDIIAVLLALRILFRFFGASEGNVIVDWLYDTTGQLIAPFTGIFPNPTLEGAFVIDVAAVIALIVYSVIGFVILSFISDLRYRAAERDLDEEEVHTHRRRR